MESIVYAGPTALTKRLWKPWAVFIEKGLCWSQETKEVSSGGVMVERSIIDSLFVVPIGAAVVFLVWVFWNLTKQINR